MLTTLVSLLVVQIVSSLKCHICKNSDDPLCFELERANGRFLQECRAGENECAILQERSADPYITRRCVPASWRCDDAKFKCDKCSTDGCNIENEVKPKKIANIIPPTNEIGDLLKANSTAIGIISLLVVLSFIWCAIRCCSRKSKMADDEEEEEEREDDCDEYYVNETNIDLE